MKDLKFEQLKDHLKKKLPRIRGYQSCTCNAQHTHHSRGEARYCDQLHLLMKAGYYTEIETQKHYDLYVNGVKIIGHRPDFLVTLPDGLQEIHEWKGFPTEKWQIQMKLFKALHPNTPYIVKTRKDLW